MRESEERRGSPTIYQKNGVRGVERYRALLLYWESLDESTKKIWCRLESLAFFHSDCTIALIRAEKAGQENFDLG